MLYLGTTPLAGMIKTKLLTASGSVIVPDDVYVIWVDAAPGGGGGAGGDPTPGGGGGGGSSSWGCRMVPLSVDPESTLTITVGAGGLGGLAGADGGEGNATSIVHSSTTLLVLGGPFIAFRGTADAGGVGGSPYAASANTTWTVDPANYQPAELTPQTFTSGFSGGALNVNGNGRGYGASLINSSFYGYGGTGGPLGGGGGAGGCGMWGNGGNGGSNGAAGTNATGYGAGGGGGSGDSAGGNGSPGFIRIYYISKYTIA